MCGSSFSSGGSMRVIFFFTAEHLWNWIWLHKLNVEPEPHPLCRFITSLPQIKSIQIVKKNSLKSEKKNKIISIWPFPTFSSETLGIYGAIDSKYALMFIYLFISHRIPASLNEKNRKARDLHRTAIVQGDTNLTFAFYWLGNQDNIDFQWH